MYFKRNWALKLHGLEQELELGGKWPHNALQNQAAQTHLNDRIPDWFGIERTLKADPVPTSAMDRDTFP